MITIIATTARSRVDIYNKIRLNYSVAKKTGKGRLSDFAHRSVKSRTPDSFANEFSSLNHQKAAAGEYNAHALLVEKGYKLLGNTDGKYSPGKQGIDGVYQHPNPPPDFVITEAKYGKSRLGKTSDGKQMNDKWVNDKRLKDAGITSQKERDRIRDALEFEDGSVEKLLIRNKPDGSLVVKQLDSNANIISKALELQGLKMLRDTLKDKAYFDENIDFKINAIEKRKARLLTSPQVRALVSLKVHFTMVDYTMIIMHQCYSRGDELNELKPHLKAALEYRSKQKQFADELPPEEQRDRIDWEELHLSDLERTLTWLAFAYCLCMGQSYCKEVLDLIANQGRDALFDAIAVKLGDTEREVAESVLFKRRFNKLFKVIEAEPAERPKLMLAYLDAWYKLEGSPDYHLMDGEAYDGYWCWEAALITKLYEIDDRLYIDHQYYPKDLVHWSEQ